MIKFMMSALIVFILLIYQELENLRIEISEGGMEMIEWMRHLMPCRFGYNRHPV